MLIGMLSGLGTTFASAGWDGATTQGAFVFAMQSGTCMLCFSLKPEADFVNNFFFGATLFLEGASTLCLLLRVPSLQSFAFSLALVALVIPVIFVPFETFFLTPLLRALRERGCRPWAIGIAVWTFVKALPARLLSLCLMMFGMGDISDSLGLLERAEASAETLLAADEWLDGPIRLRLRDGTIRLLRCDWLADEASDRFLATSPTGGGPVIRRRQDMPDEAFVPPAEAEKLFASGERKVLVLSYGWHTGPHPDPTGMVMREVRRYLRDHPSTHDCGLFWDMASRPQPPCTDEEREIGNKALMVMSSFYASITGTTVIQQKAIPHRPSLYDGTLQLFGLREELRTPEALSQDLSVYGVLLSCEILPAHVELNEAGEITKVLGANAYVRFTTQEEAEEAADDLRLKKRACAMGWNATPYEGVGGRGWCLVEQGAATVVVAHLNAAEQAVNGLPPRFERAQNSRPKCIDLTGGQTHEVLVHHDPEEQLDQTMAALGRARFTFPDDQSMAEEMLSDFARTIRMATQRKKPSEPRRSSRRASDVRALVRAASNAAIATSALATDAGDEQSSAPAAEVVHETTRGSAGGCGELELKHAVRLQASWRKKRGLRHLAARRAAREQASAELAAAIRVQAALRSKRSRRDVAAIVQERRVQRAREVAARRIQRSWRMRAWRDTPMYRVLRAAMTRRDPVGAAAAGPDAEPPLHAVPERRTRPPPQQAGPDSPAPQTPHPVDATKSEELAQVDVQTDASSVAASSADPASAPPSSPPPYAAAGADEQMTPGALAADSAIMTNLLPGLKRGGSRPTTPR